METLTKTLETINEGKWQWQSNADPWSNTEPPQWESYTLDQNHKIEKAYYDQQKEVDLGDYLVYPLDLLQKKKGNPMAQRPIRRIDWMDDEEMNDRSKRYFDSELPKTINRIFGGLGDFISFFSRRNKDILDFTSHFKELEKSSSLDILNQRITPKLVNCLEEVLLKPIEEKLNDSSITPFKKKTAIKAKAKVEELISPFRKTFSSFEEFYKQVLRAYTMNTDLYPSLNKYLRNESWMEFDKLLPYAFCLCKAFFNLNVRKEDPGRQDPSEEEPTSKILYRGTSFDEYALSFYDTQEIRYFSWNAVTSTTTNQTLAKKFMDDSVDKEKKKDPVMFIIEVPEVMESEEYLKWLDIRQYSAIPKEDEVILPPGSVFELKEVFTDADKKTTIKIKLKNEVQSLAYGGLMMQGTLQSQMTTEKEATILCLDGEELSQALISFHGNQLIEEVEFCLCIFDEILLKKMFQILPTIEKLKKLKFISCIYEGDRELAIEKLESNGITRLEIVEANDFFLIICNENQNQVYWKSLKELDLDFQSQRNLQDEEITQLISQGLKNLPQLTYFKVNLDGCEEITNDGVNALAQGLNSMTQLRALILDFSGLMQITDKGVANLASQGLQNLSQLISLTLDFDFCHEITDKGVSILASEGLSHLPLLKSLDIGFESCNKITDGGVLSLASNGLLFLSQLTSLSIHFTSCQQITDKFFTLASQGFDRFTHLTSLCLDFEWCPEITDKGLKSFANIGLKCLAQLTSLTLNFKSCTKITDQGLKCLASNIQENLIQLSSLDLSFGECKKITDEGLDSLTSCLVKYRSQLVSLSLTFFACEEITSQGIKNLALQGLQYLTQLTSLTLDFFKCKQVTHEGVRVLMSEGLKDLAQLTSLNLNFRSCHPKIEEEIPSLTSQLLKRHVQLSSMTVNLDEIKAPPNTTKMQSLPEFPANSRLKFIRKSNNKEAEDSQDFSDESQEDLAEELCDIIVSLSKKNQGTFQTPDTFHKFCDLTSLTFDFEAYGGAKVDQVVQSLTSHALPYLTQLKSLTLYFYMRDKKAQITDEAMNILAQGLKSLTQLTSLTLDFSTSERITDKGVIFLARNGLRYLSQLSSLTLNFFGTQQITDEGVGRLASDGLKSLTDLTSLDITFAMCKKITDQGMVSLAWYGLRHLCQLDSLTLSFVHCVLITAEGVTDLAWYGLRHLPQLKSLTLSFAFCYEIIDEGLSNLASQGLQYLSQLNSLSLNFLECKKLTDEGMTNLSLYGLRHLAQLKSLNLNFRHASQLTDEGVDCLVSKGIKNLKQLTSLTLDISFCDAITDNGVNNLILRGIKNLPQLAFLDLSLLEAMNISDFTIHNIVKVLYYFGFTNYIDEDSSEIDEES